MTHANDFTRNMSSAAIAIAIVVALFIGFAPPASCQTPAYNVEDLGALQTDNYSLARGINASGVVVGLGYVTGGYKAFRYTDNGGMENLGSPMGMNLADAWDVNNVGEIVGSGGADPYMYSDVHGWHYLGSLGGDGGEAYGINDAGVITGYSYASGSSSPHAFMYNGPGHPNEIEDLIPSNDYSYGRDINNSGQITGYMLATGYRAFRWTDGNLEDLGVLPGMAHSFGYAINETGQVTGYSSSATGNAAKIFRYTDGTGMEDLGGQGEENTGWGINSNGDVVGRGNPGVGFAVAVLYTNDNGLQNLNDLIDPGSGWFLSYAFDINDAGQIVGAGTDNFGHHHAVRLTPTATAIQPDENQLPVRIAIDQNYPNPFNASTTISFTVDSPAKVKIDVFDLLGRKVATLVDGSQQAGNHQVIWDASEQASGVYFYRITAGGLSQTRSMALLK